MKYTLQDAITAARKIIDANEKLTPRALRDALGSVSFTDILPLYKLVNEHLNINNLDIIDIKFGDVVKTLRVVFTDTVLESIKHLNDHLSIIYDQLDEDARFLSQKDSDIDLLNTKNILSQ
jgi:hypothetical protein